MPSHDIQPPRRNERGERTRNSLLDAAERVFSANGYQAASIRDIAAAAGINLGAVHHHFKRKEELFHAAVWRKEPRVRALIEQSLAQAEAAARPGSPSLETLIAAYLRPLLTVCISHDDDLRDFVRMTSHLVTSYNVPEVRSTMRNYTDLNEPLIRRLRAALPGVASADFFAWLYSLAATVIFVEQETGFVDQLTDGHHRSTRLAALVEPLSRSFAAGLRALTAEAR